MVLLSFGLLSLCLSNRELRLTRNARCATNVSKALRRPRPDHESCPPRVDLPSQLSEQLLIGAGWFGAGWAPRRWRWPRSNALGRKTAS